MVRRPMFFYIHDALRLAIAQSQTDDAITETLCRVAVVQKVNILSIVRPVFPPVAEPKACVHFWLETSKSINVRLAMVIAEINLPSGDEWGEKNPLEPGKGKRAECLNRRCKSAHSETEVSRRSTSFRPATSSHPFESARWGVFAAHFPLARDQVSIQGCVGKRGTESDSFPSGDQRGQKTRNGGKVSWVRWLPSTLLRHNVPSG